MIRVTPDGRLDRVVDLPVKQPTCVAFRGDDRKTLYVTSASQGLSLGEQDLDGALLAVPMSIAGLPPRRFAT